jgi:hypothetical protein
MTRHSWKNNNLETNSSSLINEVVDSKKYGGGVLALGMSLGKIRRREEREEEREIT